MTATPILVAGYYGYGNLGDEAIRVSLREKLVEHNIDALWLSARPQTKDEIDRRSLLQIFTVLRRSRALVLGGGGLLQNRTSERSLLYYLGLIWLARLAGRPVLLLGQGIGPIDGRFARLLTRLILKHASYIGCRDRGSVSFLRTMELNAMIDGDLFFLLPPVEAPSTQSSAVCNIALCLKGTKNEGTLCHSKWVTKEKRSSAKTLTEVQDSFTTKDTKESSEDEALDPAPKLGGVPQPITAFDNPSSSILRVFRGESPSTSGLVSQLVHVPRKQKLGITAHSKRQGTDKAAMAEKVVRMLDEVSRTIKISVTLLPFFPAQDLPLSEKIASRLDIPHRIVRVDTIDNTMHVLEDADLVISSRLHGLEFALRAGTPMIAINEDQKIDAFVDEVEQASGFRIPCTDCVSSEQVVRILDALPAAASVREAYLAMHARATEGFSHFIAALEGL